MKVTVIGTIARDTIFTLDGERIESYGGILYNVVALANLADADTTICPVCNLGEDIYETVVEMLQVYPNLDLRGIRKVPQPNNHVTLIYRSPEDRVEILHHCVPPVSFEQVEPFLDSSLILSTSSPASTSPWTPYNGSGAAPGSPSSWTSTA